MSREYKFRAWDKKKNIFVPQGEIVFSDYVDTKVVVVPNCVEYIGDSWHEYEDLNRFEIVQFTEYYDNNGVEIYEGDIISTPYYGDLQVVFSQHSGGWGFYPIDKNAMCSPSGQVINDLYHLNYSKDVDDIVDYFNKENNSNYFIIGNIYENPELLECR